MNRFFVDSKAIDEDRIEVRGEDLKHIKNVLRLREGDRIELVADRKVYLSEIVAFRDGFVETKIVDTWPGENESDLDIYLYQGLAKGSKMDYILQKSTEIGVKKIYPIETHRTVVKLKGEKKIASRIDRWNQICLEAAKQSKRDLIPKVEWLMDFEALIKHLEGEAYIVVPYELETSKGFKELLSGFKGDGILHIIIGPEGGFEEEEIERLLAIGAESVSLGPRILRTETAGIVAATMALYECGDLGVR